MNIQETISYIHSTSWRGSILGLERMRELLGRMGNPQERLRFVHVAGTNGKGSTCAMLASVLTSAGYKTGLYTSPYINSFNERIQVDARPISDEELIAATLEVKAHAELMADKPTEFEMVTAIGLVHFVKSACDIVMLEVGLGGRMDATNVISSPRLAVITPISLDHVKELGDTVEKIAAEKAGIIKKGGLVVSAPQEPSAAEIIESACRAQGAELIKTSFESLKITESSLSGHVFDYGGYKNLRLRLAGLYQPGNAATVLECVGALRSRGMSIPDEAVYEGLARAAWPARFEIVSERPCVILDGGHNIQGAAAVAEGLELYFPGKKVIFLFGVMADKDYDGILDIILPHAKELIAVTPDNPRALPARELAAHVARKGFSAVRACEDAISGMELILKTAGEEDVICALGSFYMVGALRRMFGLN